MCISLPEEKTKQTTVRTVFQAWKSITKGRKQQFGDVSEWLTWCSYCKHGTCDQNSVLLYLIFIYINTISSYTFTHLKIGWSAIKRTMLFNTSRANIRKCFSYFIISSLISNQKRLQRISEIKIFHPHIFGGAACTFMMVVFQSVCVFYTSIHPFISFQFRTDLFFRFTQLFVQTVFSLHSVFLNIITMNITTECPYRVYDLQTIVSYELHSQLQIKQNRLLGILCA